MENSIYSFIVKNIDGNYEKLEQYRGKVIMIVNVASKCGFTPQYEGLQRLYTKYKERYFVILGFPANDFLWQEPGQDQEIKQFCQLNYNVTFPLFSKISVKKKTMAPLYKFLTEKKTNPNFFGKIKWNFTKFLIDRKGIIVDRFEPAVDPESEVVIKRIEELISIKPQAR